MKFTEPRPFADPEVAARKLVELANTVEALQNGRIHVEKIQRAIPVWAEGTPAEYKAGLDRAIANGWLVLARERHLRAVHAGASGPLRKICARRDDAGWVAKPIPPSGRVWNGRITGQSTLNGIKVFWSLASGACVLAYGQR
jgi:hypothetical protein